MMARSRKLLDRMTVRLQSGQSNACENPSTSVQQTNLASSREMPPLLQKDAYPLICFWTRAAHTNWLAENKGITDGLSQRQSKRGRPSKNLEANEDHHHPYIEDANGTPVNSTRLYEISRKARRLWNSLDEKGMAPTSSTGMSATAYDFYAKEMLTDFLEFRLAAGMWKLDLWTSKNYSSWYQAKHNKRKRNETASSSSGSSSISGSSSSTLTCGTMNVSASNTDSSPDVVNNASNTNNNASNADNSASNADNNASNADNTPDGVDAPDTNTNASNTGGAFDGVNNASNTGGTPNSFNASDTNNNASNTGSAPDGVNNTSNTNAARNMNASAPGSASDPIPNGAANTPDTNAASNVNASATSGAPSSASDATPSDTSNETSTLRARLRRNNPW